MRHNGQHAALSSGFGLGHLRSVNSRRLGAEVAFVNEHHTVVVFPMKSLQIPRILTEFTMKLHMSRQIAVVGATTTNLLKNLHIAQLFH